MPIVKCFAIVVGIAIVIAGPCSHAQIVLPVSSDFDSGTQGWTWTSGVSWQSVGGNSGGYLRFVDNGPATGGILTAPSSFLGDWSNLDDIGQLSYDFRVFDAGTPPWFSPSVSISGPGGAAAWSAPLVTQTAPWQRRTIPIIESEWNVTSGTWTALLQSVATLVVTMPVSSNATETTGVDNVALRVLSFPGTQEALALRSALNGATCDGDDIKSAAALEFLSICIESIGGAFWGAPLFLGAEAIPGGASPVAGVLPFLWLGSSGVLLVDGSSSGPLGGPVVIPGGNSYGFQIPPALSGLNVVVQAVALSPAAILGVAFTEAHLIQVL